MLGDMWRSSLGSCLDWLKLSLQGDVLECGEWKLWSLAFAAFSVVLYFCSREETYDLDKIPGPWKNGWPLLGNLRELLTYDYHRTLLDYADMYGGIVRLRVLWVDAIMVTEPRAVAKIMGSLSREGAIDKAATTYGPVNEMVEAHGCRNLLTSLSDEQWKITRKAMAVAFSQSNIQKKFEVVLRKTEELTRRLENLDPRMAVDVDQAALRVTLDVIGLIAFGHDFDSVRLDKPPRDHLLRILRRCFTEVQLRLANPFRSFSIIPRRFFTYGSKGAESFKHYQGVVKKLFQEILSRGPPARDDVSIAAQLMRLRNKSAITDERMLSEIGILFVEGFETTGHTVSWTLFCIATSPGVQRKVAEELDAAGLLRKPGHSPRELVYSDLRRLTYLNACMKESMRMFPVVSIGNGRMTNKVTKVGPYNIPPGVLVGVPLYVLHNTKHNWDSPMSFRPERWLEIPTETYVYSSTDPQADRGDSMTYMPFSEGPRNCAGQSLAKMEVLTLLAKLLSSFEFKLAPEMGGPMNVINRQCTHLTLQTKGPLGIRMLLTKRNQLEH